MALTLQVPRHLTRAVSGRFQDLSIDDLHKKLVLGTFADRAVVEVGARQPEQGALAALAQIVIPAHYFLSH